MGVSIPVSLCSWTCHSHPFPSLLLMFFSSYCSRPPDLTALSRHDLEDNLLNSLVILEVLSRQLQDWKSQLTGPHPEVQDSSTQTDTFSNGVRRFFPKCGGSQWALFLRICIKAEDLENPLELLVLTVPLGYLKTFQGNASKESFKGVGF